MSYRSGDWQQVMFVYLNIDQLFLITFMYVQTRKVRARAHPRMHMNRNILTRMRLCIYTTRLLMKMKVLNNYVITFIRKLMRAAHAWNQFKCNIYLFLRNGKKCNFLIQVFIYRNLLFQLNIPLI